MKRYQSGCIIVLFVVAAAFLGGCKKEAQENDSGIVEQVEDDKTTTAYDELVKPEVVGDAQETESDIDTDKIYERFLNGELAVAHKDKQVFVSELFWDNNIEYCFCDIDGDGNEELHIRDSVELYSIMKAMGLKRFGF